MHESPEHKSTHVRVTRIHATGGATTRDVDIRDREQWKRLVRGAKETLEQGGEHHMRPLYTDDAPAVSVPAPLKLRVEALEAGLLGLLEAWDATCRSMGWLPDHWIQVVDARKLLAKKPGAKETPLVRKPETKEAGN